LGSSLKVIAYKSSHSYCGANVEGKEKSDEEGKKSHEKK
jgi:TolB-like protein